MEGNPSPIHITDSYFPHVVSLVKWEIPKHFISFDQSFCRRKLIESEFNISVVN